MGAEILSRHSSLSHILMSDPDSYCVMQRGVSYHFKNHGCLRDKNSAPMQEVCDSYDAERVRLQKRASLSITKEARAARRNNQIQEQEFFE